MKAPKSRRLATLNHRRWGKSARGTFSTPSIVSAETGCAGRPLKGADRTSAPRRTHLPPSKTRQFLRNLSGNRGKWPRLRGHEKSVIFHKFTKNSDRSHCWKTAKTLPNFLKFLAQRAKNFEAEACPRPHLSSSDPLHPNKFWPPKPSRDPENPLKSDQKSIKKLPIFDH